MSEVTADERWLSLCETVARELTPKEYDRWIFMVGLEGTSAERIERGREALSRLHKIHLNDYTIAVPSGMTQDEFVSSVESIVRRVVKRAAHA